MTSARPAHGLVIGKFYPPHDGHHLLVRAAAAVCTELTVLVMASDVESIPLATRVAWMREVHAGDANVHVRGVVDNHPIDYESDAVWSAHVALMREAAAARSPVAVDAVFSSESYGGELARRLGARHVAIDAERLLVPVSATRVRADPAAYWHFLRAPVRAGLTRALVLIGAESTGKSTLAHELTDHLRARGGAYGLTQKVDEYGRDYTIERVAVARAEAQLEGRPLPALGELTWDSSMFEAIARAQNQREDEAARLGGPLLVCDTDAFATSVWHERYLGIRSPAVEALARQHALYVLVHADDVPFAQDGIRDGQHLRSWMTERFATRLRETGRRFVLVRGAREQRRAEVFALAGQLIAEGLRLAAPLG